jgi:hypothetical protein
MTRNPRAKPLRDLFTLSAFDASAETMMVTDPKPTILPASAVLSVFIALGLIELLQLPNPLHIFVIFILPRIPHFTEILIVIFSAVLSPMFFTVTDTEPKPPFTVVISNIVGDCCFAVQDVPTAIHTSIRIMFRPDAFRRFFSVS